MAFFNSLIQKHIEQNTYYNAYNMAGTVGQVLLWLIVLWYIWRMRLNPLKAIPIAYIGFWFTTNINGFILFAQSGFTDGSRVNLAVAFVYLLPVSWLLAKLFRMRWQTVSEMITFGILAFHIPGRSGCIFTGCCYGYPCKWGLYSLEAGEKVFPVVFVESLMTLAILIFLLIRIHKKDYVPDGLTMPWALFLYGIGRFYTEFLRDNEKIWLGCSDIAFHALFMAVVGYVMLYILFDKRAKEEKRIVIENSQ
ncbi:MAG: prolipoprotein diacylglyceryl transferase [Clostridia bacterium]|nr:prolipoprotein diacylglyceryl transferase [Clostridia bacterium]MBR3778441.1 prolipoprotein diacylglyceryl transferase [Clostridia bacterium]